MYKLDVKAQLFIGLGVCSCVNTVAVGLADSKERCVYFAL